LTKLLPSKVWGLRVFLEHGVIYNDSMTNRTDTSKQKQLHCHRCLFTRANALNRRFWRCSVDVKLRLFRTFCLCFYDLCLWKYYKVGTMNKLAAAYVKCIKIFFDYSKFSSVTIMLVELGLPSFNTVLHNAAASFNRRLGCSANRLVIYAVFIR